MEHILDNSAKSIEFLEGKLFPSIYKGETILFLGAGASVVNKKYLSQEIIEYYQDKLGIDLEAKNLIEFMDLIRARDDFDRNDFDNYVLSLVDKLEISSLQRSIAQIKWEEIITTNYDLLIETAFNQALNTNGGVKLRLVRNRDEYHGHLVL